MKTPANGTPANTLDVQWRKPARSGQLGNCVEVGKLPDGSIAVRNSRFPNGPALVYTRDEMAAWIGSCQDGDFDNLTE